MRNDRGRVLLAIISLSIVVLVPPAVRGQSGRSWLNGLVFGDSETAGLEGASVELLGDQGTPRLKTVRLKTTTNPMGKYSFEGVPYGRYTFRASAQGFKPYEIDLYVASDALTSLHVKLRREGGAR